MEENHTIARGNWKAGLLALAKEDLNLALMFFDQASQRDAGFLPAFCGKAICLFLQDRYFEAVKQLLAGYRSIAPRIWPDSAPDSAGCGCVSEATQEMMAGLEDSGIPSERQLVDTQEALNGQV
jgi:hypothetical protein